MCVYYICVIIWELLMVYIEGNVLVWIEFGDENKNILLYLLKKKEFG